MKEEYYPYKERSKKHHSSNHKHNESGSSSRQQPIHEQTVYEEYTQQDYPVSESGYPQVYQNYPNPYQQNYEQDYKTDHSTIPDMSEDQTTSQEYASRSSSKRHQKPDRSKSSKKAKREHLYPEDTTTDPSSVDSSWTYTTPHHSANSEQPDNKVQDLQYSEYQFWGEDRSTNTIIYFNPSTSASAYYNQDTREWSYDPPNTDQNQTQQDQEDTNHPPGTSRVNTLHFDPEDAFHVARDTQDRDLRMLNRVLHLYDSDHTSNNDSLYKDVKSLIDLRNDPKAKELYSKKRKETARSFNISETNLIFIINHMDEVNVQKK